MTFQQHDGEYFIAWYFFNAVIILLVYDRMQFFKFCRAKPNLPHDYIIWN